MILEITKQEVKNQKEKPKENPNENPNKQVTYTLPSKSHYFVLF
jgi:hypothetical protein